MNNKRGFFSTIFVLLIGFLSQGLCAQDATTFVQAIRKSDYPSIERMMDDEIDLCIKEGTEILTKATAMVKIKQFLSANPPKQIDLLHKGKGQSSSSPYHHAKMMTSSGETYRVLIYFEGDSARSVVKELRFERN